MKRKYQLSELIHCPHCKKDQEGPAQDWVIPGRIGTASSAKEQCGYCDKWFSALRNNHGEIEVE